MSGPSDTSLIRSDAARNVERIIAAGRKMFERHGPFVPFYEIARAAGVGQGTLYRHFPNQQALVRAIFEENTAAIEQRAMVLGTDDGMVDLLGLLAELMARNEGLAVLLADDAELAWLDALVERVVDLVASTLFRAQATGRARPELDREDVRTAVSMLAGSLRGIDMADRRRQAERSLRLLLDGMLLPENPTG